MGRGARGKHPHPLPPKTKEYVKDNLLPGEVKNSDFSKSLGVALPGVENVVALQGSIFKLSRASQLPYNKNIKMFEGF